MLLQRADLEIGRGDFDAARAHLEAALATVRETAARGPTTSVAELALWERRWPEADEAVREAWRGARPPGGPAPRLALRQGAARTGRAGRARPRPPRRRRRPTLARSGAEVCSPRAPRRRRGLSDHTERGRLARRGRGGVRAPAGVARPELWSAAAETWERLERPPLAAYCRWREAEALVAAGASRTEASAPLREAHTVAARIGARPLVRELELLAERARLDLAPPEPEPPKEQGLDGLLGLTPARPRC